MASAFYLSAAHKSSGKTTISIGLAAAMADMGLSVQCFKKGPDYIDPMWLKHASGRPCFNLDFNVQTKDELHDTFSRSAGCDLAFVEGNKGLYDGTELDGSNSNAAMARLLELPVLLVVDCQGITRGIAPLLQGYIGFEPMDFAGVVLNKTGGQRHQSKLLRAIEAYTDLQVFGAVPNHPDLEIKERHLGLVPSNEHSERDAQVAFIKEIVNDNVDLALLKQATSRPGNLSVNFPVDSKGSHQDLTIAVAKDEAFGFYYADDLEWFERLGAKLAFFSPIHDSVLPKADGVFIGGGFPESFSAALAANQEMLTSIRAFSNAGGPIYAECGGLMYLSESLETTEGNFSLAGVLPIKTSMRSRPQGRGYVQVVPTDQHPWNLARQQINAHEFHYSSVVEGAFAGTCAYEVRRGYGIDGAKDGVIVKNTLATYLHQRHTQSNPWVAQFLDYVETVRTGEFNVD